MNKTCIIVAGPTAVGKTTVAIELAKHFSTEIISSDSRQCYTELNVGVAKPSADQLAEVPHHFINSHSIHQTVSAADFEAYALEIASTVFSKTDTIVLVGGTGLYIKAFCEGLDDIPSSDEVRIEIQQLYKEHGMAWLTDQLAKKDPQFYNHGEMQNPHRMMRALEVVNISNRSILSYYSAAKKKRDFDMIKIGLELPRQELYENIDHRTDQMMKDGLLEEVEGLQPYKELNALQTVGYRELFAHLEGGLSLERATALIKQNTRHYAKRQMTWFKKDPEFSWMQPKVENVISRIEKMLSS